MKYEFPELPETSYLGDDASYGYDAQDMRQYAEQAVAPLLAEIERLEKLNGELLQSAMVEAYK